jgi:hypothetical protein
VNSVEVPTLVEHSHRPHISEAAATRHCRVTETTNLRHYFLNDLQLQYNIRGYVVAIVLFIRSITFAH